MRINSLVPSTSTQAYSIVGSSTVISLSFFQILLDWCGSRAGSGFLLDGRFRESEGEREEREEKRGKVHLDLLVDVVWTYRVGECRVTGFSRFAIYRQ